VAIIYRLVLVLVCTSHIRARFRCSRKPVASRGQGVSPAQSSASTSASAYFAVCCVVCVFLPQAHSRLARVTQLIGGGGVASSGEIKCSMAPPTQSPNPIKNQYQSKILNNFTHGQKREATSYHQHRHRPQGGNNKPCTCTL